MKNTLHTSNSLNEPKDWKSYYSICEKIKSDLVSCSADLRFLRQLLDRYFNDIVKNEHLDEIRESLIRFQDLCYDTDHLKKRIKDQQSHLIDIIKGVSSYDQNAIITEQSDLENRIIILMKKLKTVKKELLFMAEQVEGDKKDNDSFVYQS
ncbi:MAG: hypothetical protein HKP49_00485 [Maribacter sp.]|nr:hypothetical protein [Maribacter sp.]